MPARKKFDVVNTLRRLPTIPRDFFTTTILSRLKPIMPTSFVYNVTWRCNARCVMCDNWKRDSDKDLTLAELREALGSRLFRKVRNIGLSGGEPYLRSDLPEIVRACVENMPRLHKLTINTNGFLPDRTLALTEEIVRYAEEQKFLFGIRVSIDGFEETHDRVRGVSGGYRKAMETFERLRELRGKHFFNFGIAYTITPDNIPGTEQMYAWCRENDIDILFNVLRFATPMLGNEGLADTLVLQNEQIAWTAASTTSL